MRVNVQVLRCYTYGTPDQTGERPIAATTPQPTALTDTRSDLEAADVDIIAHSPYAANIPDHTASEDGGVFWRG